MEARSTTSALSSFESFVGDEGVSEAKRDNKPHGVPQTLMEHNQGSMVSGFGGSFTTPDGDHFENQGENISELGNEDVKDLYSVNLSLNDEAEEVFRNEGSETPHRGRKVAPGTDYLQRYFTFGDSIAKALKLTDEISV